MFIKKKTSHFYFNVMRQFQPDDLFTISNYTLDKWTNTVGK